MKTLLISLILTATCLHHAVCAEQTPAPAQRVFETPIEAADALIAATKTGENAPLLEIFGTKHRDSISAVDPERDRELRARFAMMAEERRRFRFNDDGSVSIVVGYEAWPFPIPLVKTDAGWHFDTDAGILELVKRRIGENELTTIATLRAYVDAQRQYAAESRDGTEVRQFARKFQSSPGKKDGLYWPADSAKGEEPSPTGPEIKDSKTPYAGYYFKILTAQGASAPAGNYSYVINGRFIGGYAMIAWPADYGKTGVMTFLVNHYGDVYQKDLGPKTAAIVAGISEYNPDSSWTKVIDYVDTVMTSKIETLPMKQLLTAILLTAASTALGASGHTKGREVAPFTPEFKPGDYVWKPEVSPAGPVVATAYASGVRQ